MTKQETDRLSKAIFGNRRTSLVEDEQGRIIYTRRGEIERGTGSGYAWHNGYSATATDGGVMYPWMTKRECQADARAMGTTAVFID